MKTYVRVAALKFHHAKEGAPLDRQIFRDQQPELELLRSFPGAKTLWVKKRNSGVFKYTFVSKPAVRGNVTAMKIRVVSIRYRSVELALYEPRSPT